MTVVIDDYTATTVIRTFTSGSNSGSPQSLDIHIVNDNVQELTETIFVRGSESDDSAQFSSDTATVNILGKL